MNINETLLRETKTYFYQYESPQHEIKDFLTIRNKLSFKIYECLFKQVAFLKRQRKAIQIIEDILVVHGKERLLPHVVELARVEHGIRELEPRVRDHVVHAVLSFILGIYLNEKFLITSVNDFQWKLAGLLHDVGYPAQVAKDILKPFTVKINEISRALGVSVPDVYFKVVPVGLENLTNGLNSFDLIQKRLNGWGLQINVKKEYNRMVDSGDVCHGIISSLAILYIIDLMYQKCNPKREHSDIIYNNVNCNQTYFEKDVISACSAIYIHNLPSRCFARTKIDRLKAPVAFLLKLSDCLQDWERPSFSDQRGLPATQYDITIGNNRLFFRAKIPSDRKDKIKDEIFACLDAPDVQIY